MTQSNDSTTKKNERTPIRFPKVFLDPTAKEGEFMTDEEQMKFLGTTPAKMERLELQIEYNKTDDPARKQELLKMMNDFDRRLKEQMENEKNNKGS